MQILISLHNSDLPFVGSGAEMEGAQAMKDSMFIMMAGISASALTAIAAWAPAAISITDNDILPIMRHEQGSGNGTLDLILFTESAGGANNTSGPFNGDDANTAMPTGNGHTTASVTYVTSMGELKNFYRLNFPDGNGGSVVSEIAIFVDVNETGQVNDILLDAFEIVANYNQGFSPANDLRNNPHLGDVPSNKQNAIDTSYSGGTVESELDANVPKLLTLNNQGGGWADHVIFTGIDPFSFADNTRVLFHWESSAHDSGGETIFLSGEVSPGDVWTDYNVPEPATTSLAMLAFAPLLRRSSRSR